MRTLKVITQDGLSQMNLVGNGTFGRYETKTSGDITTSNTRYYHITDHLGSTREVVNNSGSMVETFDYYPFGLLMPGRNGGTNLTLEKFTGKERDTEVGLNLDYFGARYYDPALSRWHSVDPLYSERPGLSPYNYVQNDPINRIDPTGALDVIAASEIEQEVILNTLSEEERLYVSFDENGLIDKDLISSGSGGGNFSALQQLATSETVYEVFISSEFEIEGSIMTFGEIYIGDPNDQGIYSLSTFEEGFQGITLIPNETSNGNAQIHLNNKLSRKGLTETFSHEAYGHAYLFDKGLPSDHIYERMPNGIGFQEGNMVLRKQIIERLKVTRINMSKKND